jgi:hypothetical protein
MALRKFIIERDIPKVGTFERIDMPTTLLARQVALNRSAVRCA